MAGIQVKYVPALSPPTSCTLIDAVTRTDRKSKAYTAYRMKVPSTLSHTPPPVFAPSPP